MTKPSLPSGKVSGAMVEARASAVFDAIRPYVRDFVDFDLIHHALTAALSVPALGTATTALCDARNAAFDESADLCSALSTPQAGDLGMVKVKSLEWSSEPPYRVARPFAGIHYATEVVWPENGKSFDYVMLSGPTVGAKRFASLSDAKAAAQQDYESRILSALSSNPVGEMVPGLLEAARLIDIDASEAEANNVTLKPEYLRALARSMRSRVELGIYAVSPQGGR